MASLTMNTMNKDELMSMISATIDANNAAHRLLAVTTEEGAALAASMNAYYLLYAGALVFMMQAGFAMLCAGSLRMKNIKNIMLKNLLDACVGALAFWLCGYGIAYGNKTGTDKITFAGDTFWMLGGNFESIDTYHGFFFQFAFAATAATIVSGAVAERCQMTAYACYSFFLTAWVYPVAAHTIWSPNGFLSAFRADKDVLNGVGVIDFAGCGVVHMVGGASAMIGAAVLGPRLGRFNHETGEIADPMPGHNAALVVLGTFLLWFGWYGFNPGSTLAIHEFEYVAAKTATTTTLAAAAGAITNLAIHKHITGVLNLEETCNGALAGLVSITSACSVVEPWAAVLIGAIGAVWYTLGARLCLSMKIDDPVNAAAVHYYAGVWGLLAPGFFAKEVNMIAAYDVSGKEGFLYSGSLEMMGAQIVGVAAVTGWVCANMCPFFVILKCLGIFRVSQEVEEIGMDESEHGGGAYHMHSKSNAEELDASTHGGGSGSVYKPVGGVQNPRKYNQYTKGNPPKFPKNQNPITSGSRSSGTPNDYSTQSAPVASKGFDLEDLSDPRRR